MMSAKRFLIAYSLVGENWNFSAQFADPHARRFGMVIINIKNDMNYEHHIFLSYAHGDLWTPWVRNSFLPRLNAYLQLEVGRLEISVDYQIEPGAQWGTNLHRRVARSKLMLPLLSADYFQREWCRREMALMFEREKSLGLQGRDDNYGLLIPVRLGDGLTFPELIGRVQYHNFEDYADPDLPSGSERASKFNESLRKLAQTIARTLPRVPHECSEDWHSFTGDEFYNQLCAKPFPIPQPPRLII
jgi:hypothetical protein